MNFGAVSMPLTKIRDLQMRNVCLLLTLLLASPAASADEFEIISGSFFMATVSDSVSILEPGNNTGILTEGVYQGETPSGPYPNDPVNSNVSGNQVLFAPFPFFGQPVGSYTAENGVDAADPVHAAANIDLVAGVADLGSFYAYWNGTEFNQGHTSATVIDNFDGTYKLFWSSLILGGPFDGKTGDWTMLVNCTTCPPSAAGPSVVLSGSQGGFVTHTVTQDAGDFVVSTDLTNVDGYSFNWSPTDDLIDGGIINADSTMTIDPSLIPVGTYLIKTNISNNNNDPVEKSASTMLINVVATGVLADIADDDNDGVPNAVDSISDPLMLQGKEGDNDSFILSSSAGILTLGDTAQCVGNTAAAVSANDIKNNVGTACTAATNVVDTLGEVETGIGGYYDFAVRNLTQAGQVQVALPLTEPLADNAGYRSYSFVGGWKPFATTDTEAVYSAAGTSGNCPSIDDASWVAGLKKGDNCIRLTITDGGANDADGVRNFLVRDPGA